MGEQHPLLVSFPLKKYEDLLPPQLFFRLHQSYLVNLSYIKKFIKADGGGVLMKTGEIIPIARRKKIALMQRLGIK